MPGSWLGSAISELDSLVGLMQSLVVHPSLVRHEEHWVFLFELVSQICEDLVVDGIIPGRRVVNFIPLNIRSLCGLTVENRSLRCWSRCGTLALFRVDLVLAFVRVERSTLSGLACGAVGVGRRFTVCALKCWVCSQGVGRVGTPELPTEVLEGTLVLHVRLEQTAKRLLALLERRKFLSWQYSN